MFAVLFYTHLQRECYFFFVECNFTCLMCVCDKCNDFVFHYLLDYSCRALLVDSVLFLILEKTVDFIQCMCVENSFALVSFAKVGANQVQHFAVVLLFFECSFLQAVEIFCLLFVLLFTAQCFYFVGFKTTTKCPPRRASCSHSLRFPAFSLNSALWFTLSAKKIHNKSWSIVSENDRDDKAG